MFFFGIFHGKSTCPAKWKHHIGMKWHLCWFKHFKAEILNYHLTKQYLWHRRSLRSCCFLGLFDHVHVCNSRLSSCYMKRCFADFGQWDVNYSFAYRAETSHTAPSQDKEYRNHNAKSFPCVLSAEVRMCLCSSLCMLDWEFIGITPVAPSYCICWSVGLEDEPFQVKKLYFIHGNVHLPRAQVSSSSSGLLHSKLKLSY